MGLRSTARPSTLHIGLHVEDLSPSACRKPRHQLDQSTRTCPTNWRRQHRSARSDLPPRQPELGLPGVQRRPTGKPRTANAGRPRRSRPTRGYRQRAPTRSTRASPTRCRATRPEQFLGRLPAGHRQRQAAAGVVDQRAGRPTASIPGRPTPVQGAWFLQEVLDALTANPEVWSKTVLLVNFDENDGYFDHVPLAVRPVAQCGRHAGRQDHADRCPRSPPSTTRSPPPDGSTSQPAPRWPRVRPRPARADVRDLAVEPGRLGQLAGVRPHLGAALPGGAVSACRSPISARSAARSAAT